MRSWSFHESVPSLQEGRAFHSVEALNEVFNVIKDHSRVKHPKSIQYDLTLLEAKKYFSYHDNKGHPTVHYRSLQKYLKEFVHQGFLKEFVLASEAASNVGQLNALSPTQSQHMVIQYKMTE